MNTIWILGDQLHLDHPCLAQSKPEESVVLMIESRARANHLKYHQIKLTLMFSAMRHRAAELKGAGWKVDYHELVDDYKTALEQHLKSFSSREVWMQEPADFATSGAVEKLATSHGVKVKWFETNQFLVSRKAFGEWAGENRHLLMENHYRKERKRLGILIDKDGQPEGGAWNFDAFNRKTFGEYKKEFRSSGASGKAEKTRETVREEPDDITHQVIEMVREHFPDNPGDARKMWLPVSREGANRWLENFVQSRLASFGAWEDVMVQGEPTLFHSVISPLINLGLLTPRQCVDAAVAAYRDERAPINSVEGFVRQIIGWREFINGVYWHRGPQYRELNELVAARALPDWIYTGETEMNCLSQVIKQAVELGYNHHIQRLMILGNFFLLGGFEPRAVLNWYLEMYVDAYDWVMMANVIGMILFADGGYMSTKPYAAGSAYINKMSDYCEHCVFDPKIKTGPKACPFNYLYWNFFAEHEERFVTNPRVSVMVKVWQKKTDKDKALVRESAKALFGGL